MVAFSSYFMLPIAASLIFSAEAGYAPNDAPELPKGFCPKSTGTITSTTGGE